MMWYLKQLLPLTYRSHYRDLNDRKHFCVWKMLLGKCYRVEDHIVV